MTKYIVVNENMLGYRIEERTDQVGILHGSILRGYTGDRLAGWTFLSPLDNVRDATLQDFEDYRVSPKGHLTWHDEIRCGKVAAPI